MRATDRVIRHVDQHFRANAFANPLMEDAHGVGQINSPGVGNKTLQIDVLHRVRIDHAVAFTGTAVMRA